MIKTALHSLISDPLRALKRIARSAGQAITVPFRVRMVHLPSPKLARIGDQSGAEFPSQGPAKREGCTVPP